MNPTLLTHALGNWTKRHQAITPALACQHQALHATDSTLKTQLSTHCTCLKQHDPAATFLRSAGKIKLPSSSAINRHKGPTCLQEKLMWLSEFISTISSLRPSA